MGRLPPIPENPPELRPLIKKFLKQADEFDRRDTVVAYYCRVYAAQLALAKFGKNKQCLPYLMQIMDAVEADKKALKDSEALKNDVVAQTTVWTWAMKVFNKADTEERAGRADMNVAGGFMSAMVLFEVMRCFGPHDDEVAERHKYAKWKAAYIVKCINEGTVPIPGPQKPDGTPLGGGAEDLGMGGAEDDPAASGPAATYPGARGTGASAAPAYSDPPAYPPAYPPAAAAAPEVKGGARASLASLGPVPTAAKRQVSITDSDQAAKFCKYAISALQYSDVDTAVDNLLKALRLLAQ